MSVPAKHAPDAGSGAASRVIAQLPHLIPSAPAWRPALPGRRRTTAGLLLFCALGSAMAFAAVIGLFMVQYGTGAVLVSSAVGLIPLAILIVAVHWLDHWEPEPLVARGFAFLWGGGVSIILALLVDRGVTALGAASDPSVLAVTQAPVVEEIAKGLGVLLVAVVGRRYIDGPVDGVVYAAMVATGFTFSEDVLYFAGALNTGGVGDLAAMGVIRGLFSPFAHTMFTACVGLAVGSAVRRPGRVRLVLAWLGALVPATALHALWNYGAWRFSDFVGFYFSVQVPMFVLAVGGILLLRRAERASTRERLTQYERAGWFDPAEVEWLASVRGRARALRWAARCDAAAAEAMRRFIRDATRLAALRDRIESGRGAENRRDGVDPGDEERNLLESLTASRALLSGVGRQAAEEAVAEAGAAV